MAERYLFFNSMETAPGEYDREYKAQDFAEYFGSVLSSGLLHTDENPNLVASVETGTMNTVVTAGNALIKGHLYENTAPLTLTHSFPEPTMDRIDRIVLRLDLRNNSRFIKLFVKEGVSASAPVAPVLQRDDFIHELSLAQIRVRKNTVQLLASDIVDERLDESLCGLVYSLISIPSDQLQNWITARISELEIEADKGLSDYLQAVAVAEDALQTALQQHVANAQGLYDSYSVQLQDKLALFESDFMAWFNGLKEQLDKNVALSLQNQINILNGALDTVEQIISVVSGKLGDLVALETAAKQDIVAAINEVVADLVSHSADDASLTKKGHVQLNNTVTSTLTNQAATAHAVKTAYDKAKEAIELANGIKPTDLDNGRFQSEFGLSNSILENLVMTEDEVSIGNGYLSGILLKPIHPSSVKKWGNTKWKQTLPQGTNILCDIVVRSPIDPDANMIPAMTSNTSPSGTVIPSTEYAGNNGYKAFDGVLTSSSYWRSTSFNTGSLAYKFATARVVSKYSLHIASISFNNAPRDWTFEASNNGTNWVTLDTQFGITWGSETDKKTFSTQNTTSYLYYRINVTRTAGGGYVYLTELSMYEYSPLLIVKQNITSLQDLSDINVSKYPSIILRWALSRNSVSATSPTVSNMSITWEGEGDILVDIITGTKYKLQVENGSLVLLEG